MVAASRWAGPAMLGVALCCGQAALATSAQLAVLVSGESLPPGQTVQEVVLNAPAATVFSLDLRLSYDPPSTPVIAVQKGGLASGMMLATRCPEPGVLVVALAGGSPIGGEGTVVSVTFGTSANVTLSLTGASVNEGGLASVITVNTAPALPAQADRVILEGTLLRVTNTASDADVPTNTLSYALEDPPAGAAIDNAGVITWTPSIAQGPGLYTLKTIVTDNGVPQLKATNSFTVTVNEPAAVVGRKLFYNGSAWDGNNAAANASDDAAIAPDKVALLPGGVATFANYSSYSRGINGIMVDIASLAGTPGVDNFAFKVGNNNTPAGWSAAPAPGSITVRSGAGTGGSARVTLIWANNAIQKKWLQVAVKATANTGLATEDVFFFGNAIGESGNSSVNAQVDSADEIGARNNPHSFLNPAPLADVYDYDRNKRVDANDEITARNNATSVFTALKLINLANYFPSPLPCSAAPELGKPMLSIRRERSAFWVRLVDAGSRSPRLECSSQPDTTVWEAVAAVPDFDPQSDSWTWQITPPIGATQQFYRVAFHFQQ